MLADRRFTEMVSILGEKVGSRRAHGDTLPRGFVGDRSNTRAGSWVISTPEVLKRLLDQPWLRPYNFLICPMIDNVAGYPMGVDPKRFLLVAASTDQRSRWVNLDYVNIHDGKHYPLALQQSARLDKVIPQTFGYVLRLHPCHPESKSLAPDLTPCVAGTNGLLQRSSVIPGTQICSRKETDRRWEQGEDLSMLTLDRSERGSWERKMVAADPDLLQEMNKHGVRELMRTTGLSQHTLAAIRRGQVVRKQTLVTLQIALRKFFGEFCLRNKHQDAKRLCRQF